MRERFEAILVDGTIGAGKTAVAVEIGELLAARSRGRAGAAVVACLLRAARGSPQVTRRPRARARNAAAVATP